MSKRLPYEEYLQQQWTELPLPDEDRAWADMKQRLDEDDDDGIIVWWKRGCLGWALLLLLLLSLGWWLFNSTDWFNTKSKQEVVKVQSSTDTLNKKTSNPDGKISSDEQRKMITDTSKLSIDSTRKIDDITATEPTIDKTKTIGSNRNETASGQIKEQEDRGIAKARIKKSNRVNRTNSDKRKIEQRKPSSKKPVENEETINSNNRQDSISKNSKPAAAIPKPITPAADSIIAKKAKDSLLNKAKDSLLKKAVVIDSTKSKDLSKKKKDKTVFFSAGLGIHQQLPIAGQKLTPYNAQGRKGSLMDYIPSVYFRLNKADKWFIQSEFRYGAPQYNKEILYNQKSELDPLGRLITSSRRLKKTFYHQLPLTFNYYVLPNLSIGAGVIWNKFSGAVFDQEVSFTNGGNDTLLSTGIFHGKKEKEFSRSYFQGILETQYKWKRFSLGGRYTFGLQPYIRFTLPNSTPQSERNQSAQVFLRFELWKNKK